MEVFFSVSMSILPGSVLTIRCSSSSPGDSQPDLKVRSDFIPELWSSSGTVTGPLQLVEDGKLNSSSLAGKIAVQLEDRIASDDPEFPVNATEGRRLQDAGAIAVIIVQNSAGDNRDRIGNLEENFQTRPSRAHDCYGRGLMSDDYPTIPVVVLSSEPGKTARGGFAQTQAGPDCDTDRRCSKADPSDPECSSAFIEGSIRI
jgi:hypothetical protein